jgi:hypothetical protein
MTFRYPVSTRTISVTCCVLNLGGLGYYLVQTYKSTAQHGQAILTFLVTAVLLAIILANLKLVTTEVGINETGITDYSVYGTRTLRWRDVEDLVNGSRLLLLRGPQGRPQISLFRGEYGLSLEPFEEMRELILAKVQPLLLDKWRSNNVREGRSYPYPALSFPQMLAYVVTTGFAVFFFLFIPVRERLFGFEHAFYLALSFLAMGVFLLRDLRKARRRIVLHKDGFRESNGGNTVLRWDEVTDIVVREPVLGSGSFVVSGKQGKVTIPMRMRGCGELFFLLTSLGKPRITYGHEL